MSQKLLKILRKGLIAAQCVSNAFPRSTRNELDDNIQIYVHIILECSAQVTSRCNTSEAPSWQCHDVNWSPVQCLSCLPVHVILSSDTGAGACDRNLFTPKSHQGFLKVLHEKSYGSFLFFFSCFRNIFLGFPGKLRATSYHMVTHGGGWSWFLGC